MVIVMIFERIIENRQIAPENGCIYDRPKNRENNDENDEKMNDPKSIQNHFGYVPMPSGHQKTCQNIILSDLGASGKKIKNSTKNLSF